MKQQLAINLVPGNIIHHDRVSSQNGSFYAAHALHLFTSGWSMMVAAVASQLSGGHGHTETVEPEHHEELRPMSASFTQIAYNLCVMDSGHTSVRMFNIRNYLTDLVLRD
jgi:hypothetical protein